MSAARFIPLQTYDEGPPVEWVAIPGSEQFGIPRWPITSMGIGDDGTGGAPYTLVPLSDDEARVLVAGDLRLMLDASGMHDVRVTGVHPGVAYYTDGTPYEVPVIDAEDEQGRARTFAPCDVFDVAVSAERRAQLALDARWAA